MAKKLDNDHSRHLNPLDWLNHLVSHPFYFLHFLSFFSYLVIRSSSSSILSPHFSRHLLHREIQAILAFSLLTAVKIVRDETWEDFIANTLFFAKLFLVAISLVLDYHLTMWYIAIFSVIYILTSQPAFEGLGTASKLTPLQLETLLTEGNTSRFWLVEFSASSSSACVRASRCFPELSITYSNKNLSFGIVDLGLFPNVAEQFGIPLSGGMGQLPTYILFENATEVSRLPEWNFMANASHPTITKTGNLGALECRLAPSPATAIYRLYENVFVTEGEDKPASSFIDFTKNVCDILSTLPDQNTLPSFSGCFAESTMPSFRA